MFPLQYLSTPHGGSINMNKASHHSLVCSDIFCREFAFVSMRWAQTVNNGDKPCVIASVTPRFFWVFNLRFLSLQAVGGYKSLQIKMSIDREETQQRLKAAVHFTVGRLCQRAGEDHKRAFSRQAIAAISETAFRQCGGYQKELQTMRILILFKQLVWFIQTVAIKQFTLVFWLLTLNTNFRKHFPIILNIDKLAVCYF